MEMINVPPGLIRIIKECMAASRVTVMINGSGQGFIKPTRGLRQGCPLSPYIFILAMEFLSKQFQLHVERGTIKGIRLTKTAPRLTHVLYADDLMIMGKATTQEAQQTLAILQEFATASGLQVNPNKSTMWFSSQCDENCKEVLFAAFGARPAEANEKYLGIIVSQSNRQQDVTHGILMDKLYSKLAGWKVGMLSFAGRVTLLKSVLASIPVYYMTVAALSLRTITEMNRLFRRFVWGKLETDKYISFVAWGKICEPADNGGLGVRDTKIFKNSLLLKVAWQLVADEDRIWVKVFHAKYFPRAGFWDIKNTRDSSSLWKSVQGLKGFFDNNIKWQIGDGRGIAALNQPWFPGWSTQTIRSNEQRDLKVADLFDPDRGAWKFDKIRELFGAQAIQVIMDANCKPQAQPLIQDRLIWTESSKGRYSTKEGYKLLSQQRNNMVYEPTKIEAWKRVWSWKGVIPRVKMFLWKSIHGGIATLAELHKRIRPICPKCPRIH